MSEVDSGAPCTCLLVALCGLPGSGKTTLCAGLLESLAGASPDLHVVHVSFDEVHHRRAAPDGGVAGAGRAAAWSPEAWQHGRAAALAEVREAMARAGGGGRRTVVLADDNAWYRSMRRTLYAMARDSFEPRPLEVEAGGPGRARCGYATLYVPVPLEVATARDASRPSAASVGPDVVHRMAGVLQPPPAPHGDGSPTWEAPHVYVVPGTEGVATALARVTAWLLDTSDGGPWAARHAPDPLPDAGVAAAARARTSEDLLHQGDLWLRRAVSAEVSAAPHERRQQRAAAAGETRARAFAAWRRWVKHGVLAAMLDSGEGFRGTGREGAAAAAAAAALQQLWDSTRAEQETPRQDLVVGV